MIFATFSEFTKICASWNDP